jgi:hypothetical protein
MGRTVALERLWKVPAYRRRCGDLQKAMERLRLL